MERKEQWVQIWGAVLAFGTLHLVFMGFSGKWPWEPNPYNSYTLQSVAWLQGRLDLGQNYPWLELAVYQGRYYVSFPPFPSYVMLPFAAIFGENTPDTAVALGAAGLGCAYGAALAARRTDHPLAPAALPVFLYCGTAVWQVTVDGAVWFLAQNFAMTLTLMSFYYGERGAKGRALFFLACAVGCRPFQIFYLPVLFLRRWEGLRQLWRQPWVFLPALAMGITYMVLNGLRFGNPFTFGHRYLPEFSQAAQGQFSWAYVLENLSSLVRLPSLNPETGCWEFPLYNGMNVFLAFPLLAWYGYRAARVGRGWRAVSRREWALQAVGLGCMAVHLLCLLSHRTMGGYHFGNRYVGDLLPCAYLCLCALPPPAQGRAGKVWAAVDAALFQGLFLTGTLVNFLGVLAYYQGE